MQRAIALLEKLMKMIKIHSYDEFICEALEIAKREKVTVYDASYLALALRLRGNLVTLDVKLWEKVSDELREHIAFPEE